MQQDSDDKNKTVALSKKALLTKALLKVRKHLDFILPYFGKQVFYQSFKLILKSQKAMCTLVNISPYARQK